MTSPPFSCAQNLRNYWNDKGPYSQQLRSFKAKPLLTRPLSSLMAGEPTVIIRDSNKEAVLVSFDEWERPSQVSSFTDLLLAFPGEPGDIPERPRKLPRTQRGVRL